MTKSIVVVGGSLAGLMHGLQLKREGNNVTILEREPVSERSSHAAGIGYKAGVEEILRKYDDTGLKTCFTTENLHFAYRRWPNAYKAKLKYQLTSWGLLYRVLRANFDGLVSNACPSPPPPRATDGQAAYLTGKQVHDITYSDDTMEVHFTDTSSGKADSITADLVIGADGVHSTVREIVKATATKQYSGYVSWRGTVTEKELTESTARYFTNGLAFDVMSRSYMICYVIPTDDGCFDPGERLINWVWYYNVAEGSPEMKELMTASDGRMRSMTVPQGLVSLPVWEKVRATNTPRMATPFAELLNKTSQTFVTKVNDVLCTTACYFGGRVILVGDAMATFRPHVALSTEQAAQQCIWMGDVTRGSSTMQEWERHVSIFAKRIYLLSRLVGEFGQGSVFSFLRSVFSYLSFMVRLKFKLKL
ncbi:FAD binding domain protein [Stachybotrys elegans]|uniref:FAD binding domain protein n=1 Tax=Stachybotrys elegans TaxID=80388 RepID=A0A8K0WKC5_9HYPO|nr:FAD binding domain protein [Stachybotrys elegans]